MLELNVERAYLQVMKSRSLEDRLDSLETLAYLGRKFLVVRQEVIEKLRFIEQTHYCYNTRIRAKQILEDLHD